MMNDKEFLFKILNFVTEAHGATTRKESLTPYIFHPLEVEYFLASAGITDVNVLGAAICHDLLEDTEVCFFQLVSETNDEIACLVDELTHHVDLDLIVEDLGVSKKTLKRAYYNSFQYKSLNSFMIKMADNICNVLNFFDTNPVYAKIYYKKCDLLYSIFEKRKEEFPEKLRKKIINKIKQIDELCKQ